MPLYEYRCKQCGHQFEKIQTFSAADEKECPVCKGELERLISAPAIQFKGSGFYSTDYGTKGSSKGPGKSADSGNGADKPAAASSDSGSASTATPNSGTSSPNSSKKSE